MAITWTSDLDTHIDEIDAQHKRIVTYINQLEVALQQQDKPLVGRVIGDLVDYTVSHFAFEEKLMADVDYKFLKLHRTLHQSFTEQINGYRTRHLAGEDVAAELNEMLTHWLVSHIKREDHLYAEQVGSHMRALMQDKEEGGWLARAVKSFFG